MNSLLLVIITVVLYLLAYRLYGRYIGNKIFGLTNANKMPSFQFQDGVDYVPSKKHIVLGHHFTTIAGLGPIVGPAIGIIWGWLHHTTDTIPPEGGPQRQPWQKEHQPNLTGTVQAYRPPGHTLKGGKRAPATGDYEPWTPN